VNALKFDAAAADNACMAAVVPFVLVGIALWTAVAFVVAVVLGHAMRRMEPIPVRASARRVVDLRRVH